MSGPVTDAASQAPSGERFEPTPMKGRLIEAEHLARYAWVAQFASNRRVLDAACGMAYGTAMMARAGAAEAVGVDIDRGVIDQAKRRSPSGTRFEVGDLRDLPFGDDEFDLVVCFEAIEHVEDPELVLNELARVLRADGLMVVSTPNRDVYTPGNPFHLRELTPNELEAALAQRFQSVVLRRQHTWIASGIFDDEAFQLADHEQIDGIEVRKACENRPGEETYTIGIAGNGELPVGRGVVSLTADVDIRQWSSRLDAAELAMATATEAGGAGGAEVELMRREMSELREQLAQSETEMARIAEVEAKLADASQALADYEALREKYDALETHHRNVLSSASWRVTRVLRIFKRLLGDS